MNKLKKYVFKYLNSDTLFLMFFDAAENNDTDALVEIEKVLRCRGDLKRFLHSGVVDQALQTAAEKNAGGAAFLVFLIGCSVFKEESLDAAINGARRTNSRQALKELLNLKQIRSELKAKIA